MATKKSKKTKTVAIERPKHYFLGEDLLSPNVDKTDGSRLNMFLSQVPQILTLNKAEAPLVFSRFENQVGKYSRGMGYVAIREKCELAAEVVISPFEKYMFFKFEDGSVDVKHYKSVTRLTESYGYENDLVDHGGKTEFDEGDLLFRNRMYDDDLNLRYGVNLKAVFLANEGQTFEDGIMISEEAAKKFEHTAVYDAVVTINNNDVLLNLLGDKDVYKPHPGIGEDIVNGILCARRRLNYSTALVDFRDGGFAIDPSIDTAFFFKGKVVGIEVFSNLSEEELAKPQNQFVKNLVDNQINNWSCVEDTIEEFRREGYDLRQDCSYLLQKAKDMLSGKKFSYDRSEFEGTTLRFTIMRRVPFQVGSKISNRMGGKGVISRIVPMNEMPTTEDGRKADVILNPLGVHGRMNPSQLYEHELNYIASEISRKYEGDKDIASHWRDILEFFDILGTGQADFLREQLGNDAKKIKAFVMHVRENGLYIHQPPFFDNYTPDQLLQLYRHFEVEMTKFEGIDRPLVFGSIYFMKLRHEPAGKLSSRAAGQVSILDVPFKSNERYKKGTANVNDGPVRFGKLLPN